MQEILPCNCGSPWVYTEKTVALEFLPWESPLAWLLSVPVREGTHWVQVKTPCPFVFCSHMVTSAPWDKAFRQSVLHPSKVALLSCQAKLGGRQMSPCQQGLGTILTKWCLPCLFHSVWMPAAHGSATDPAVAWNSWMSPSPRWWPQSESGFGALLVSPEIGC